MWFFRHVTQTALVAIDVVSNIASIEEDTPVCRLDESGEDLNSRALTGTIRPEIAKNLTTRDLERHILYRGDARVKLTESLYLEQSKPPIIAWKPTSAFLFLLFSRLARLTNEVN